jgi:hypothetical protein
MKLKFLNPNNWGITKIYRDFDNYRDWIKTIKKEEKDPNSKYNQFKLSRNYFYNVYLTVSLDDVDLQTSEIVQRLKIVEMLNPLHRYLDDELGFAECLTPEFNQFVDDKGNKTLTYLVMYRFSFNKFSLNWLFKWIVIIGILWFVIAKYSLFAKLWSLI